MNGKDTVTAKNTNSTLKILGICIAIVAIAFAAVWIFKVTPANLIFVGALLLCPLLHIFMMRGGDHKH